MSHRRREALGRNRRGPATRNYMPHFIVGLVLFVGLGFFSYRYFTAPQRVFGAKVLKCRATEITWTVNTSSTVIVGCGRSIEAKCTARSCRSLTPDDYGIGF